MTARKVRTAIYFTQRYEKLRPYDDVKEGKSHGKQSFLTKCLFPNGLLQHPSILHYESPVCHGCKVLIVGDNDESVAKFISKPEK